jgi:hypothetical protein
MIAMPILMSVDIRKIHQHDSRHVVRSAAKIRRPASVLALKRMIR